MAALHSLLLLLACSTALITAAPVLLQKHGARSESVQQAWIKQLIHQATSHAAAQQPEGVGVIAAQPSTSSLQSEVGFGCDFCRVVSTVLELYLEGGAQEEEIAKLIGVFCVLLEIEDQNVCDLVVEEFKVQWTCIIIIESRHGMRDPPLRPLPAPPGLKTGRVC